MAKFTVGFDGKWQETFDDRDDAVEWAREVAATGRTVEVIKRRFGGAMALLAPDTAMAMPMADMVGAVTVGMEDTVATAEVRFRN